MGVTKFILPVPTVNLLQIIIWFYYNSSSALSLSLPACLASPHNSLVPYHSLSLPSHIHFVRVSVFKLPNFINLPLSDKSAIEFLNNSTIVLLFVLFTAQINS